MAWKSTEIINDRGDMVMAQAPEIISASRSTDIPAFYADWFFNRLKRGHSAWINPFNGKKSYISYQNTRLIVFWSKNPAPLLPYINYLKDHNINFYIQFTLNDYVAEGLEKGVPPLNQRIETFIKLVEDVGKGRVIWRFDPLILTKSISIDSLVKKIEYIGNRLREYNEHFVFSFADICSYKKVAANLQKGKIEYIEFDENQMIEFSLAIEQLNKNWNFSLGTCAEKISLEKYGIVHNKCIDEQLMIDHFSQDKRLMDFLGVEFIAADIFNNHNQIMLTKSLKDKGQRALCGCITSKDIGQYNTCPHLCEYCYANSSKELASLNYKTHLKNPFSETIIGI